MRLLKYYARWNLLKFAFNQKHSIHYHIRSMGFMWLFSALDHNQIVLIAMANFAKKCTIKRYARIWRVWPIGPTACTACRLCNVHSILFGSKCILNSNKCGCRCHHPHTLYVSLSLSHSLSLSLFGAIIWAFNFTIRVAKRSYTRKRVELNIID